MHGLAVTPARQALWQARECITAMAHSPCGHQVAIADAFGDVSVYDYRLNQLLWSKFAHEGGAHRLDWSADAEQIVSSGHDASIKLWQPTSGNVTRVFRCESGAVEQLKCSPDNRYLAAGCSKTLLVWDQMGEEVIHYPQHNSTISALMWKQNTRELATACYKSVNVFRVGQNKPYQTLNCLGSLISLCWRSDGKAICAGSQDRMLHYWNISKAKTRHSEMTGYAEKVSVVDWDSSGQQLASAGGKQIVIWNTRSNSPAGTQPRVLSGHQARVTHLRFQQHAKKLASAACDGSVNIWSVDTQSVLQTFELHTPIKALTWSFDDASVLLGDVNGMLYALDVDAA